MTNLRARAISAGVWAAAIGVLSNGVRILSSLALTRLLTPDVFGVVALATAFTTILSLVSDVGLKQFLISSRRGEEPEVLATVWTLSVSRGIAIAILAIVLAIIVYVCDWLNVFRAGSVYARTDFPYVLAVFGLTAIVLGFKSPRLALLERNLDLRTVGLVDLIAQIAALVTTVSLAWFWRSIWAIVAGAFVSAGVSVLLSLLWGGRPVGRLGWNRDIAQEVVRYGRWILLASTAYVLASNADRLLLGNILTATMLGLYMIAVNVTQMFEQILSKPFAAVALPTLSEAGRSEPEKLRTRFLKMRLPYDLSSIFLAGVVFSASQLMIDVLYDPRYSEAGGMLRVLSFSLLFPRYSAVGTVHTALGDPRTEFLVSLTKAISIVVLIPIGLWLGGFMGVIWAIALHMVPGMFVYLFRNHRYRLNNFKFELLVLLMWPVGYLVGLASVRAMEIISSP